MTNGPNDFSGTVAAARAGDSAALRQLVQTLADDRDGLRTRAMLADAGDEQLWRSLLQFSAHGAFANPATPVDDDAAADAAVQRARETIESAFTANRAGGGEPARRAVLQEGLTSPDPEVRAQAAEISGRRGDVEFANDLTRLADDKNDHVRAAAVRALAQMPSEVALPTLLRALQRYDVVAAEAVNGLVQMGEVAVPALLDDLGSRNSWARWHAARALGGIRDPRAIEPLIDALNDDNGGVRWQAVYALSQFGDEVIEPLLRVLTRKPITAWFAEGAVRVLDRVAQGSARARLTPLMQKLHHLDAAVEVPVEAARLLGVLGTAG
jgi:HEAT repeat protein